MDRSEQRAKRRRGDYDIDAYVGGTGQLGADLDELVYGRYHSTASENFSRIKDAALDGLLEKSRQEVDPAKRREVLRAISLRIADMVHTVDSIYVPRWDVWHPHVKQYRPHFSDMPTYRHSWVSR